ncbi:MFS transporter [Arthrobacter sp. H5]|uniref:MFS transporter n=1 Tax=Arthrobacter sp. H5 TaxID=1267973 RepID=UPI0004B349D3|nr:MFS transporter [Arthrobacter sp. H5]
MNNNPQDLLSPRPSHQPQATPRSAGRFSRLPQLAGSSFIPLGFVARLPLAMLTVGALTLVTAASGSYAAGGFTAGAVGIGSAVGAPALGYLADRVGQRPVLLVAAMLNTAAIVLVIAASNFTPGFSGSGLAPVLAAAFLMGATCPQIGPLARVRWMALTTGKRPLDLDTALSYESTADELTFVLGPALVGLLASLVAPWLPLALAAVLTIAFVTAFAVHPTEQAVVPLRRRPSAPKQPGSAKQPGLSNQSTGSEKTLPRTAPSRVWLLVPIPVLGMVAMGTFFGSTQTALIAFAGSFNAETSAGLLYAVMGLSSAVAALSVAYWPQRIAHSWRWVASAAAMCVLASLLFLPQEVPLMLLVLFALGIPVGPTMVTIFSIGSVVAPRHLMGTVMTMLASGIVAGTALGAALAGAMAENSGYSSAFAVSVAAAVVLLLLGLASAAVLRRAPGNQRS